ncbi:MAG TPA: hypothetical protein VGN16_08865 [Acidobacteriaceae bacterium]|jgi:hypothetical protein
MRYRVAFLFAFYWLMSCAIVRAQLPEVDETTANFVAIPGLMRVGDDGKYPAAHIVLFKLGCRADGDAGIKISSKDVTLALSGGVPVPSGIAHDDCSVWFDLATLATDHGAVAVKISQAGTTIGTAFLHFADPLAKPIPTTPQVDVMWAPIGYETCKKAFGRPVAKAFWCIALKIGNNSGYQLQIAGVGFKGKAGTGDADNRTPNSSYALTRAVAQDGDSSSARAYVLNSINATALLMAGFSPFFHAENSISRYSTGTSIVGGPIEAAFSLIWPDNSARKANNLDDQSLRDGKLIPNNTQVTTVVFLDKGSIAPDFIAACKQAFKSYDATKANPPFGTQTLQQISDAITEMDPSEASEFLSCTKGKTSTGLKAALGDLVLVGDTVQYMQRIVVDQSVQSQEVSAGAQPTGSSVVYTTLTITAAHPEQLPVSLNVLANGATVPATFNSIDGSNATYTMTDTFPNQTAYTISDPSGGIRVSLKGNVADPSPTLTSTPDLTGQKLTFTGTKLLQLPPKITVTSLIKGKTTTGSAQLASKQETVVVYTLAAAPDANTDFQVQKTSDFPLDAKGKSAASQ